MNKDFWHDIFHNDVEGELRAWREALPWYHRKLIDLLKQEFITKTEHYNHTHWTRLGSATGLSDMPIPSPRPDTVPAKEQPEPPNVCECGGRRRLEDNHMLRKDGETWRQAVTYRFGDYGTRPIQICPLCLGKLP